MMANQNTLTLSSVSSDQSRMHIENQSMRSSLHGPVAILWDIENCPVPSDVRPEDVAGNIRMALKVHPVITGVVTMFSAYGDFNSFPRRLREGCQRTGVKLIDVPNGRKDAADKAILIDMFLFALDNRLPSSIMLISGDVDFAPALHILGQRGYTVILVIPSGVGVSSALSNAGRFVWDWSSIARGEGFVPPAKFSYNIRGGRNDVSGNLMGGGRNDMSGNLIGRHSYDNNTDGQNEEEAIVYRGISQSYYNSRDFALVSNSVSEYKSNSTMKSRSLSLPSGLNEVSSSEQNESVMWVQPGDLNGLKGQLVKLLELSGGCLPFARVPGEYHKVFGRPLYVSEYGAMKLVNLLKKMGDTIAVEGKGQKRYVCIRTMKPEPSAPQVIILKRDEKGKGIQEEIPGSLSSDECSDDEKVGEEENEKTNQNLEEFKHELQEILVSYSCRIFLDCFKAIYQQRYKKTLVYQNYGVNELEDLFDKVRDVVVLHEEPVSKKQFLATIGG